MHFVKKRICVSMWRWITSAQLAFGSRAQATIVLFIGSEPQESKISTKTNKTQKNLGTNSNILILLKKKFSGISFTIDNFCLILLLQSNYLQDTSFDRK